MMNVRIDEFLSRRFTTRYTCWDFVREVWQKMTATDIGDRTPPVFQEMILNAAVELAMPDFEELPAPSDPCIVLFERDRMEPHIGVYLKRRVLHLRRTGAAFEELRFARMGFTRARYFIPRTACPE
jgi:hypothetical protein